MEGPPALSSAECERLDACLAAQDFETAASISYRHLLFYHWDCSWCDLTFSFPTVTNHQVVDLLQLSASSDLATARRLEDRYDFTLDFAQVRLRKEYCKRLTGTCGAVWCDRVYEYLLSRGCVENVGIDISQIEVHIPKPRQFVASICLQAVLETDYRFDVIPYHKHGVKEEVFPGIHREKNYRRVVTEIDVPACTYSPVDRSAPYASTTPTFQQPGYATTTRLGLFTAGWTDVKTTVASFTGSNVPETSHRQTTAVRYRLCYSTYVYIRENPVYTFQFRGSTNCVDKDSNEVSVTPPEAIPEFNAALLQSPSTKKTGNRRKAVKGAAVKATGPDVVRFKPGICAAAGAIYRQRMPGATSALVYNFHELIGNKADADFGAYVALRIGIQRCLENGFHPLILKSDNLLVMEYLKTSFVRTPFNYKQQELHKIVEPMLKELVRMNDFHQEALLAATTVKYINKDKIRAERMASLTIMPVVSSDIVEQVLDECALAIEKGEE